MASVAVDDPIGRLLDSFIKNLRHIQKSYEADLSGVGLPDKKNERAYYRALDKRHEIEQDIASLEKAISHIKTNRALHYTYDPKKLFDGTLLISIAAVSSGAFGTVDVVKHRRTGIKYYRKIVRGPASKFAECMQELDLNRYVTTHIPLYVSNLVAGVIRFVPTAKTTYEQLYFEQLFEYLPGSDIVDYSEKHRISYAEAERIYCMAVEAIRALHSVGIVHRDIKPDNLFLETDAARRPLRVRLIDFGASEHYATRDTFLAHGTPNYSRYNLTFKNASKNLYTGHISYQNDMDAMTLFWKGWIGTAIPEPTCAADTNTRPYLTAIPLPTSPTSSMGGGGRRRTRRQLRMQRRTRRR
jgi:hypothetical protein